MRSSMIKNGWKWFALLMALTLLLAACQPEPTATIDLNATPASGDLAVTEPAQADAQPAAEGSLNLVDTPWVLVMYGDEVNPTVVEPGTVVTAVFGTDGSLSGSGGCNGFNTTYSVDGNQLMINSPFIMTMMACATGMEQETTVVGALEKAQSYQINAKNVLNIRYDGGVLIYIPQRAPLEGTLWTLVTMGPKDNPQTPVAGGNFTARFERSLGAPTGLVEGVTGCNEYGAAYFAGVSDMKVNLPATTGKTDCAPGLNDQEEQYFQALLAARSYNILGDTLQIHYNDMVLSYVATDESAPEEAPTGDLMPLNGTKWWFVSTDNQILVPGTEITAEFTINADGTTGTITGSAGCNTYNTGIVGVFQVSLPTTTQLLCEQPAGIMEQEAAYLKALENANAITFSPEELRINTTLGTLIYASAPPVEIVPPIELTPEATQPPVEPTGEAPSAIISGPTEGQVGQPLTFNASGSSSSVEITQYSWDTGDGNLLAGVTVEHTYTAPGQYTLLLTVVDTNGQVGQASIIVTITQ